MSPRNRKLRKPPFELSNEGKILITKIEAAVNQLETAIKLWVNDGDHASICTLAFAGHEIIHAINKARRGKPMVPDGINLYIREESRHDFQTMFRLDANFVKHAAKDASAKYFLTPKIYPMIIMDAVTAHNELGFPKRPLFEAFLLCCWLNGQAGFAKKPNEILGQSAGIFAQVASNKREFFNAALPLIERQLAGSH